MSEYIDKLRTIIGNASDSYPMDLNENDLIIKPFFGGAALYLKGKICITLTTVGLALKLHDESLSEIKQHGAKDLRYFPNGHIKKQYALISDEDINSFDKINDWIIKSILYVLNQ